MKPATTAKRPVIGPILTAALEVEAAPEDDAPEVAGLDEVGAVLVGLAVPLVEVPVRVTLVEAVALAEAEPLVPVAVAEAAKKTKAYDEKMSVEK